MPEPTSLLDVHQVQANGTLLHTETRGRDYAPPAGQSQTRRARNTPKHEPAEGGTRAKY
jgi:hypothetical protein